jgi:peptide/nickel transport system substrate-binding protein
MAEDRNYWQQPARRAFTRRTALRGGALAAGGLGLTAIGCGGSNNNNNKNNSSANSAAPAATSAASAAATSAPSAASPVAGGSAVAVGSPAAAAASTALPGAGNFKTGGTIQGVFIVPANLDPYENGTYSTQEIAGFSYSRLFRFNSGPDPAIGAAATPLPELVGGYEITPDKLTYTMKLRPGVTWHPPLSRPLSTADIMASWQRFTSDVKNVNKDIYSPIVDSLTAPDDQTLVFKLKAPYVPFLNKLANPQLFWVMSADAVNGKIDPSQQIVGTGPWIFASKSPTDFTYKKNPNYFIKGIPYADGCVLNIIPDTSTQEAQFQAGKIDILAVPYTDLSSLQKAVQKTTVSSYLGLSYLELFFTPMGQPNNPFDDVRLRQAVSMAVDRDALNQQAYNGQAAWSNHVPPGLGKWMLDPQSSEMGDAAQWFKFNPQQAKQLLQASGHADTEFKFIYPNNSYGDTFNSASETLRGMLSEVGFKINSVTVDYLKDWINNGQGYFWKGLPANSIGHVPQSPFTDPDDYLTGLFTPGGLRNDENINDAELAPLIAQQKQEFDENKRVQLVHNVQKAANAKMYYVPMITGKTFVLSQPWTLNFFPVNTYALGTESYAYLALNK